MPAEPGPLLYALFLAFVAAMLTLDLGVWHRRAHAPSLREALCWTAVWSALALLFGAWIGHRFGADAALQYGTGWLIEQSLSLDNVFVFVVVFGALRIPPALQHRVLFWGVVTAVALRAAMILGGALLIARWHWLLYLLGALLLLTAGKLLRQRPAAIAPTESRLLQWLGRRLRVTGLHGQRFVVRQDGRRRATPLLLALLLIEITDVVFAVDSIPAIFAVTTDPFLVFTSNIFAILGLRSLYFVLARATARLVHLKPALALVLLFVGGKLLLHDVVLVPPWLALGVVATIIGGAAVLSLRAAGTAAARRSPVSAPR